MSFNPHKALIRLVHPLLLLLCLLTSHAVAQTPPPLNPTEARQAIELLNDPARRSALTAQLQLIAKAQNQLSPKPTSPVPLQPNSVGAQLLHETSSWLSGLSLQLVSFGRLLGNLPAVWAFTRQTFADPALRARALDSGWRLAVVLAASLAAEWLAARALRRPSAAVARAASRQSAQTPVPAALDEAPPGEEGMPDPLPDHAPIRAHHFAGFVRLLRRLPYIFICFVLDLLPLVAFLAAAFAGALSLMPQSGGELQPVIFAYAGWRAAICLTRLLFAPGQPQLRLLSVADIWAVFWLRWVRRIVAVAAAGVAASQTGLLFGLPATARDAVMKAAFFIVHACLIVMVLQCRTVVAGALRSPRTPPGPGGILRNRLASIWHLIAIFYIAALWLVWAADVRNGYLKIWHFFLLTAGVMISARLLRIVMLGGLDRVFRVPEEKAARFPGLEQRSSRYAHWLRMAADAVLLIVTALCLLEVWGVSALAWFNRNALGSRLATAVTSIFVAAAIAVVIWESVLVWSQAHLAALTEGGQVMKASRLRTLLPILHTVLLATLIGVFGLTALSEIGVDVAPLLAGAGILGVAIGFGSQKLVQDFITGIFLLIENAMQVGDYVTVAGLSGTVENLSIRTMRLRASDGAVHIIPFSSVATVTNTHRGIGNAAVSVTVPVSENADAVCDILKTIAQEMRADELFGPLMRSDLQLWGVDHIEAGAMTITGQIVCTDAGRWTVQREFNRRITIDFKAAGISFATPVQRVITV